MCAEDLKGNSEALVRRRRLCPHHCARSRIGRVVSYANRRPQRLECAVKRLLHPLHRPVPSRNPCRGVR